MIEVDILIIHATQLITCASPLGARHGAQMLDPGIITDGSVAISAEKVIDVGPSAELLQKYTSKQVIHATGKVVCPGFVDSHTHAVYAGERINEFEMRIKGAGYLEIMAAGGGIVSTATAVRNASIAQIVEESKMRLDAMLSQGTTTLEVKTGYGLDDENEMKLLAAIEALDNIHPCTLVPTFLGAHAVPPEYKSNPDEFVNLIASKMIPHAAEWYSGSTFKKNNIPFFCDVFCEKNAFTPEQSRLILEAGISNGLGAKIHADEFTSLGGVTLALEMNATSADHLDVTTDAEMLKLACSKTIGVILPAVNFNFGSSHFANARKLIDSGCAIALSTDINPGSAPCPSIPLVMAIATRYQNLMPAEALIAVTINAACAIGMGDKIGSIESGKQADILILETPDYRQISYQFGNNLVEVIIKNGMIIQHP